MDDVTYQTTTPATPPDATVIATDDVGGAHYQRVKLTDGTADGTTHAKVTTAQAGTSDGGLVTRPASVAPDVTASGTIDASSEDVTLAVQGRQSASYSITGSYTGSLQIKVSSDGGNTYRTIRELFDATPFYDVFAPLAGVTHVQVFGITITSGSVDVTLRASMSAPAASASEGPDGTDPPFYVTHIGGVDPASFLLKGSAVMGSAPSGTEYGLVTRNIPSGTQTVEPAVAAGVALSNVNDANSNTTLLSANADRRGVAIFNDSTEALYVKFGTTASTTSFTVKILAGGFYEMPEPIYVGQIDGIWSANGSGAARITELT